MAWSEKKQQYFMMLRDPQCQLSQKEIAEMLGVSLRTLQRWQREESLQWTMGKTKAITQEDREWMTLKTVLYQKALEGDVPAAKLLLQMREMNLHPGRDQGIRLEEALKLIQDHLSPKVAT
jgi:uncharacterized protein YjcR